MPLLEARNKRPGASIAKFAGFRDVQEAGQLAWCDMEDLRRPRTEATPEFRGFLHLYETYRRPHDGVDRLWAQRRERKVR